MAKSQDIQPIDDFSVEELNRLMGIERDFVPDTIEELEQFYADQGGIITFQGSAWDVVKKDKLVGVPFTIADCRFYNGDFGDAVAVMALLDQPMATLSGDQLHVVFNDGSTGVYAQVRQAVHKAKRRGGFHCPKGLRASEYTWQEKDFDGKPVGDKKPATTYYVA